MDEDLSSKVLKFADDAKKFRTVKTDAEKDIFQADLTMLVKWSEKWQRLFNFGKCICVHTGHGNASKEYFMGDTRLGTMVDASVCYWLLDFLSQRSQFEKINDIVSSSIFPRDMSYLRFYTPYMQMTVFPVTPP